MFQYFCSTKNLKCHELPLGKNSKKDKPELLKVMSLKECREKMGANVPDTTLCTETRNEDERTCNVSIWISY